MHQIEKEAYLYYPMISLKKQQNNIRPFSRIKYKLKDWISLEKLDWENLSANPNAIELLKENPKKIVWQNLSSNPKAIELLKKNQYKINWESLSENPNPEAIELLKENQYKIDWQMLSENPAIFDEILE